MHDACVRRAESVFRAPFFLQRPMKRMRQLVLPGLAAVFIAAGCSGVPTAGEQQARRDLGAVADRYRPSNGPVVLPELTPASSLSNFLSFALLNSPSVAAAFYDWSAAV